MEGSIWMMVCRGYGTIWDTTSDMVVLDGWEMTGACIVHGVHKVYLGRQAGTRQVSTWHASGAGMQHGMACSWETAGWKQCRKQREEREQKGAEGGRETVGRWRVT
jgi:hypothetical protein